ncbi:MAG: hypothetical protein PHE55_11475 [Methylococcaceae bacterium]|nr:hypothetical protein [Methylococcaceae bacterium]
MLKKSITAWSVFFTALTFSAPSLADQVLALSWEPTFCETHLSKPECQPNQASSYGASNLSLHGLWPQSGSYCGVSSTNITLDKNSQWSLLPSVNLTAATRTDLNTYMPGTLSYLERHEWIKHGTCSRLSQQNYFSSLVNLASSFSVSQLNQLLANNIGYTVTRTDIETALQADFGYNATQSYALNCNGSKLSEIQFLLSDSVYSASLNSSQFLYNPNYGTCPYSVSVEIFP